MSKKVWSVIIAGALVASVFSALPVQAAPEIPSDEDANILDPSGDANGLNDQLGTGSGGNRTGGVNFVGADYRKVWFTNTQEAISVHFVTSAPGTGGNHAYTYRIHVNDNCIWFQGTADGALNPAEPVALLRDACNGAPSVGGEITIEEIEGGLGLTTLTFPIGAFPDLEVGKTLTTPFATSRWRGPSGHTAPQLDDTDVGIDYEITTGGGAPTQPPVMQEPPVKPEEPKAKDCSKIKNKKKKKACKKNSGKGNPPAAGCAAYTPGEMGAEAETTVVTDKATEESPIEIDVPLGPALGRVNATVDFSTRVKHNVQVDSKAAEAGLFVRLESPVTDDPDLYVYWDNRKEAASAGGFNQALFAGPLPQGLLSGTGNGGHSGFGFEQIDGLRTSKCGGWTLDLVNWLGQGGTYKLKIWLGEIENDPKARD